MWAEGDEDLGLFMQRLSVTHVTRWQKHRNVFGQLNGTVPFFCPNVVPLHAGDTRAAVRALGRAGGIRQARLLHHRPDPGGNLLGNVSVDLVCRKAVAAA